MLSAFQGPLTGSAVPPPAVALTWLPSVVSSCVIASVFAEPALVASILMLLISAHAGVASPIRIVVPIRTDFMTRCLLLREGRAADDFRRTAGRMMLVSCPPAIVDAVL